MGICQTLCDASSPPPPSSIIRFTSLDNSKMNDIPASYSSARIVLVTLEIFLLRRGLVSTTDSILWYHQNCPQKIFIFSVGRSELMTVDFCTAALGPTELQPVMMHVNVLNTVGYCSRWKWNRWAWMNAQTFGHLTILSSSSYTSLTQALTTSSLIPSYS